VRPGGTAESLNPGLNLLEDMTMATPIEWRGAMLGCVVTPLLPLLTMASPTPPPPDDDPVVTEFDVVPAWPNRPAHISDKGWVAGLAIDAKDQVWFCRKGPDPIQVYTAAGDFVRSWGKDLFSDPHGLRIDPDGNIWLVDYGLHTAQKFTPEGKLLMTLGVRGEKGDDEKHFNMPTDLVVTPAGDIFVTDGYGNRRVVHFDKNGKFVKTFGTGGPSQVSLSSRMRSWWTRAGCSTSPTATAAGFSCSRRRASSWSSGLTY
jgi:hypothetical protein